MGIDHADWLKTQSPHKKKTQMHHNSPPHPSLVMMTLGKLLCKKVLRPPEGDKSDRGQRNYLGLGSHSQPIGWLCDGVSHVRVRPYCDGGALQPPHTRARTHSHVHDPRYHWRC